MERTVVDIAIKMLFGNLETMVVIYPLLANNEAWQSLQSH